VEGNFDASDTMIPTGLFLIWQRRAYGDFYGVGCELGGSLGCGQPCSRSYHVYTTSIVPVII
jgi:hypothetical protein